MGWSGVLVVWFNCLLLFFWRLTRQKWGDIVRVRVYYGEKLTSWMI